MTQDEIIAMAKEAGLLPDNSHPAPETRAMRQRTNAVQRFAALVAEKAAAEEREAYMVQIRSAIQAGRYHFADPSKRDISDRVLMDLLDAIRARGQKEGA